MAVAAAAAAVILFLILANRYRLGRRHILWLTLITITSGFIGALLFSIIESSIVYRTIVITVTGLRADGFPIAAIASILIYARANKLPFWPLLDIGTPCLILFMAIYRVGCVLIGCCYGLPCDLPLAVTYNNPGSLAPLGMPVYPTQLYHLIWNVAVLLIILLLRKSLKPVGSLGLMGWILYFAGDFVIRFFRGNEPPVILLSLSQLTDLALIAVAIYFLVQRFKKAGLARVDS